MEKNKKNIIKKNKRSTKVVIVDKFEDNPQLEGKEMQFHRKPGPIKPPGSKNPSRIERVERRIGGVEQRMAGVEQRIVGVEQRMERLENKVDNLQNILLSFVKEQRAFNKKQEKFNKYVFNVFKKNNLK